MAKGTSFRKISLIVSCETPESLMALAQDRLGLAQPSRRFWFYLFYGRHAYFGIPAQIQSR